MEKIIYSTLISILVSSLFCVLLIVVGVKIKKLIVPFILVSDVMLFIFYRKEVISYSNNNDVFYIFLYYAFSVVFSVIYLTYLLIRQRSGRCVCSLYRNPSYEEIKSANDV